MEATDEKECPGGSTGNLRGTELNNPNGNCKNHTSKETGEKCSLPPIQAMSYQEENINSKLNNVPDGLVDLTRG